MIQPARLPFPDALLASSVNGGGVFVVVDGVAERISPVDTTGITVMDSGYLWARQAEGIAELRAVRGTHVQPVVLTRASLDLHDVLRHGALLYVVATETNTVYELDAGTSVERRRWTLPGAADSQHVNSVCVHQGRILASRFGPFEEHRGYKGRTRGAGEVVDLESGEVVIRGLSQPHSLRSTGKLLWLCDSEAHAVHAYRDFSLEHVIALQGYPRGLAFGVDRLYVGVSRSRNDPSAQGEAGIAAYDRDTLEACGWAAIPVDEIYDLATFDGVIDELRRAGLQETLEEIDRVRHARNLHAAQHHGDLQEIAVLEAHRQAGVAEIQESATLAAGLRADLRHARERATESAIWADLQHAAITRYQSHLALLEAGVLDAEGRCAVLDDALHAVEVSRSWRWTGLLRRLRGGDAGVPGASARGRAPPAPVPPRPPAPERAIVPIIGLEFDEHAEPRVSILIAAFGKFAQTLACLQAIQRAGDATTFEVILVEDRSGDPDMGRFAHVPGLRYVANAENLGYLRSVNQAARLARGAYLHLLNNDTHVSPGWLDALVSTFALIEQCGMAGSKLVYPDGTLQEAGGIVWSDGHACNYGRGDDPSRPEYSVVREVDYVSGASIMLSTALFAELGGFDERYVPAYYEDTDLAFRIREAGLRVCLQPASVVVHIEGLSHGTDIEKGGKAGQAANRQVFRDRWQKSLEQGQLAPGEHVFLARDRAQLGRIVLVVDRHAPQPDRDAGSRAIWQLMRVLQLDGLTVKFWTQEAGAGGAYATALRRHGIEVFNAQAVGPFDAWMSRHARYIDHVILSRPLVAHHVIDAVRKSGNATVTFYGHDIHHQRILRHAALADDAELRAQAAQLRRVEHELWAAADLVLYPSDEETAEVNAYLESAGRPAVARTVPLYALEAPSMLAPTGPPGPDRDTLLFVGGFSHLPNADAVRWFVHAVWPLVAARHPGLRLCLAGGDPGEDVTGLAGPDVEVAGYLSEADLHARYLRARVAIAPLRFGAGIKGKIIEAMWHGVPCVTTSTGQQGLADAGALRVADDPSAMADAISVLSGDDDAWWEASTAGQAYVAERFTVGAIRHVLGDVLDRVPPPVDVAARRRELSLASSCDPDSAL